MISFGPDGRGPRTIDETVRAVGEDQWSMLVNLADAMEARAREVREEARRLKEQGPYR